MSARPRSPRSLAAALTACAVLAVGCSGQDAEDSASDADRSTEGTPDGGSPDDGTEEPSDAESAPAEGSVEVVGTVVEDLPSPWGLVELPDGELLVGSRDEGTVLRVDPASGGTTDLGSVDGVDTAGGEGGLLGLALGEDDWLYAYLTAASDNRIVRMEYSGDTLGSPEVVLDGIPKDARIHHGGGLAFGPDGMLYAATGDAAEPDLAQDPESPAGKILRMTPEGDVPDDNPEPGSLVYSLGHRNVQGLAWDDRDRLWASEFGARDLDELNLIEPGGNYGWPEFEGSGGEDSGFVDPVAEWPTDQASPSGLAYTDGALWMAALRGERLWRVPLDESGDAGEPEAFLEGEYGRLRAVLTVGPGELLLATNETDTRGTPEDGDDRLLRLTVS